jgi:hypothetical protein
MSTFRSTKRRLAAAVTVGAAAAAALAVAASAAVSPSGWQTVSTTGAQASCILAKTGPGGSRATCTLYDTSSDGDSVYIQHQVLAFPVHRIEYYGGAGTHATYAFNVSSDTLSYNWHFRVCRNRSLMTDNCSGWAYVYVS